ncbi:MAG: hypothetical protein E7578_02125 [Ruminococcaceae bacterium]|nr:hypothetical protein [Oscillospiraceae bacterium]
MRTYNNLHAAPPKKFKDIRDLFRTSAEAFGDKARYQYREDGHLKEYSYNELWRDIQSFATYLMNSSLAGKRIAIIGDTHPMWVVAFNAIICSGCVAVPLDKELEMDQIIEFMKIADCSAVVYTECFNKRFTERIDDLDFLKRLIVIKPETEDTSSPKIRSMARCLANGASRMADGDTSFEDFVIPMDDMCALLFTSGTTGTSKGVMLSHRNLHTAANACCQCTRYDSKDSNVSVLPIHHTFELTTMHIAASNLGMTTYINESIRYATRNFKEFKPTLLVLVPLFLETIHKKIWETIRKKGIEKKVRSAMKISDALLRTGVDMRSKFFSEITDVFGGRLKSVIVGGAPLDPQIIKDFYSFGITVLQGYGITECSPLISVNVPGKVSFDTVGQPVTDCEVRIEQMEGCAEGEGEILVKGGNVMMGYYENPEATAEVFTDDGWFRTGDIGRMDKKGYITITGRKKNVIIASNGKNVFPEELEERLSKIPEIKESVVLARTDKNTGDIIITALIFPDVEVVGEDFDHEKVCDTIKSGITQINKTLPSYKHINKFEVRDEEFEKTPSKKIKRFLLK